MKKLLVTWLAAFFAVAHGYVALEGMEGGACINAKLQDNFDINNFQGVWYEAQSAPNMFQLTKKCTKMEYIWNGNVVKATTTGLGEEDQPTEQSTDMTQSARNGARFLVRVPEMPELNLPFDILSTDYNSYACVYSCLKYENFKAEFTWALTRDNSKLTGAGAICKRAFQKNNIDVSKIVDTYQGSLCSAPPKTSRGTSNKAGLPTYRGNKQSSNDNVNTKSIVKPQNDNNSKENKRKYNWTPNKSSWKPYTPRTEKKNYNEVNYNAQKPYNGYRRGNQPAVTNVQSTIQKKTPYKPYQSVEVKTENKGYNPYIGYRSTKEEKINQPTVTNVQSTIQKKTSYKPYQSVVVKTDNKGYKPYVGYRSTREENVNKPNKNDNKGTNNIQKSFQSVEVKTENKGQQPYVGYRSKNIVNTNKSDRSVKNTTNSNVSPYKGLKNSNEETLIPKNKKVYKSNWGTTYGVRRQNAWVVAKQNDDASQAEKVTKVRPYSGYKSRKVKEKPKQKGYQPKSYEGYRSRNQRRRNWSTIEAIKVDGVTSSSKKPKIKQSMVITEVAVSECKDKEKSCGYWSTSGECDKNPRYMNNNCQKSCGKCDKSVSSSVSSSKQLSPSSSSSSSCSDKNSGCQGWATMGECKKNPRWMNVNCPRACGQCS